jgi:hypothetical protein
MYEDLRAKEIRKAHFDIALKSMVRTIAPEQLAYFEEFRLHSAAKSI